MSQIPFPKQVASQPVGEEDINITFTAEIMVGSHQLAPVFGSEGGSEAGTYFAIVKIR